MWGFKMTSKVNKPKALSFADIQASCSSEDYDDLGGGAFCIQVEGTVYEAKEARRLIKYLVRAEKWLANKEKYNKPGPKVKYVKSSHERGEMCKRLCQ